ncbi:MlaD family protein [Reichenbachiella versicolor]|uniref:MlaD family protein n=1 Tax=Reichenbachiella versicolor TaxID=1821036 RepID=UPI0013A55B30|nr:MlaD family protein [Reichenbachiella versicolor]
MSKEFKVGLFTVISGAILFFGFNFLKGKDFLDPSNKYYAIYDHIDGLNVSNPVIINGFSVGRVNNIRILQNQNNKILVEISVKDDVVLGKSTKAHLRNSDFMGSKEILLEIGDITQPLENGDTLDSEIDKGLAAVIERAQPLTDDIGVTISRLNEILLGMEGAGEEIVETLQTLKTTLKNANSMIYSTNKGMTKTLNSTNILLANINDKVNKLDPILTNADSTLQKVNTLDLEKSFNELNNSLGEISVLMAGINAGEGTMGKLMKDDSLYNSLNQAMIDLDILLVNFNSNPKHFLAPLGKSSRKIEKDRAKQAQKAQK